MRTVPAENFCRTLTVNVDNEKLSDADFREFVRNSLPIVQGAEVKKVTEGERRRKPSAHSKWRWPPNMTPEQIEQRIDDTCGCSGKYDCDCVSVFNKACREAWYDYNTKDDK